MKDVIRYAALACSGVVFGSTVRELNIIQIVLILLSLGSAFCLIFGYGDRGKSKELMHTPEEEEQG